MKQIPSWPIIKVIIRREFLNYFKNSLALLFLFVFVEGALYLTFAKGEGNFFRRGQADLLPLLYWLPYLFCLFAPSLSMRLWTEERKQGTLDLLFSYPLSISEMVIGKWLASWLFLTLGLLLFFPFIISTFYLGHPDPGPLTLGLLGVWLTAGQLLAFCGFISSLFYTQTSSFLVGSSLSTLFLLLDYPPFLQLISGTFQGLFGGFLYALIQEMALTKHLKSFNQGLFKIGDLFYFLFQMLFWCFATQEWLKKQRGSI